MPQARLGVRCRRHERVRAFVGTWYGKVNVVAGGRVGPVGVNVGWTYLLGLGSIYPDLVGRRCHERTTS